MLASTACRLAATGILLTAAALAQSPDPGSPPAKLPPPAEVFDARLQPQVPTGIRPAADEARPEGLPGTEPDLFADPEMVWFDTPGDGAIWARGSTYKASFAADGWQYIPFLGSDAPRNFPVRFRLQATTLGGQDLPLAAGEIRRDHRRVILDHGSLRETLDLTGTSLEQTFVFDALPRRGALSLAIAVQSELAAETSADGLQFRHPTLGGVRYERAIAIDGAGRRLALPIAYADGTIRLEVPASFVADATLPLLVDPVLHTMTVSSVTGAYLGSPDVAVYWNTARTLESCVVWRQNFSGTDVDVWARLYRDQNLAGYSSPGPNDPIPIDITATAWEAPRVAATFGPVNWTFLVVAQTSNGNTSPWWISGRLLPFEFPFTFPNRPQFRISPTTTNNDCTNPDVGSGDAYEFLAPVFTVVYEYSYSATDHDIYGQQVDAGGNVTGIRYIDGSVAYESRPRIANKAGIHTSAKWPLTYQRGNPGGDQDIRGCFLGGDGNAMQFFPVSVGGFYDHAPAVSSFTSSGGAYTLFVWERVGGGDNEIFGAVFDQAGALRTTADLGRLETPFGTRASWGQFGPSVDTDGARFAVTYTEYYQNNPSDPDACVGVFVFDAAANTLACTEPHVYLRGTFAREYAPAIAAARPYPVYYNLSHKFVAACQRDNVPTGSSTFDILAFVYDAAQPFGGYSRRPTGCGTGVSINDPKQPGAFFVVEAHIGQAMEFSMNGPPGLQLLLFGFPASVPVNGCPGCIIGVNGNTVPNFYSLTVPVAPWAVGLPISVQGLAFGGGPCLGSLAFTDTLDFVIR